MGRPLPNMDKAVVLQIPTIELGEDEGLSMLRTLLDLVPEISSFEAGTLVAIPGDMQADRPKLFDRMMRRNKPKYLHRAVRCTALFAKGYVQVGGGRDEKGVDWAFAWVPNA